MSGNRLRRALVLIKNSKLCLCEKILSRKFSLYFRGKAFFQIYEVKYIANLDDTIEFILRHNLAILSITGSIRPFFIIKRKLCGSQISRLRISDIDRKSVV